MEVPLQLSVGCIWDCVCWSNMRPFPQTVHIIHRLLIVTYICIHAILRCEASNSALPLIYLAPGHQELVGANQTSVKYAKPIKVVTSEFGHLNFRIGTVSVTT